MASPHRLGWNCPHPVAEYRLPPSQNARHTVAEVIKCRRRVKPPRRRVRAYTVAECAFLPSQNNVNNSRFKRKINALQAQKQAASLPLVFS